MVRQLEEQWDARRPAAIPTAPTAAPARWLVSGDELAAEFERFLREQDG